MKNNKSYTGTHTNTCTIDEICNCSSSQALLDSLGSQSVPQNPVIAAVTAYNNMSNVNKFANTRYTTPPLWLWRAKSARNYPCCHSAISQCTAEHYWALHGCDNAIAALLLIWTRQKLLHFILINNTPIESKTIEWILNLSSDRAADTSLETSKKEAFFILYKCYHHQILRLK